jgi:hypothetical protein
MAIGTVMWSAHLRTTACRRKGSRNSSASAFKVQHHVGARLARVAGARVYSPWPSEAQVQASSAPARREVTSTRSATMKAE